MTDINARHSSKLKAFSTQRNHYLLKALLVMGSTLMLVSLPAQAGDDHNARRTITVSASGEVEAKPDSAIITTGVTSQAETARLAMSRNSKTVRKLIDALQERGLDKKDIKTSSINIHPRYNNPKQGRARLLIGYTVTNQIILKTHDLDNLGDILDQLVTEGANQMHGLRFIVSNQEMLKDAARERALNNAQRRANLLANAAGASLGKVLRISEDTNHNRPPGEIHFARASMDKSVPIERGSQTLSARVTITWELRD